MGSRTHLFREVTRLHTDPSPFCVQTSAHTGLGTGIFFAVTLVLGAIALAAYSYFRLNRRTIGFQHFEVRMRKMGTWGWGPLGSPAPGAGLLQLTGNFPELTAGGCLAHPSCRQAGVSAPQSSSSRSSQPLLLAETGFGERVMGRQQHRHFELLARGLAWKQIHQGPGGTLPLEGS